MTETPIRTKLPPRRPGVTRRIEFAPPGAHGRTQRLYVNAGYLLSDDAAPRILEVFLRGAGKVGSEFDLLLDDVAVMASRLLQADLTPRTLREHLGAANDGQPQTIIAAVADELIRIQLALVKAWKAMTPAERQNFPLHYCEPQNDDVSEDAG